MTNSPKSKPARPNHKSAYWITRRLWSEHVRAYWPQLLLAFLLLSLLAATAGAYPLIIKYSFETLSTGDTTFLWWVMGVIVAVTSLKGAVDYLQNVLTSRISINLGLDMQKRLFAHILRADFERLLREPPGQLLSRIGNDLGSIQGAIMAVFTTAIKDVMTVIALAGSMFYLDWVMTLAVVLFYPLAVLADIEHRAVDPEERIPDRAADGQLNLGSRRASFLAASDQDFPAGELCHRENEWRVRQGQQAQAEDCQNTVGAEPNSGGVRRRRRCGRDRDRGVPDHARQQDHRRFYRLRQRAVDDGAAHTGVRQLEQQDTGGAGVRRALL